MHIDGGCHCGYITYEGEADPEKTKVCHCIDCQQLTGTAFRTFVPVAEHALRLPESRRSMSGWGRADANSNWHSVLGAAHRSMAQP